MRILIVSTATQSSKTGVTVHYTRLSAQLTRRGHQVTLVTPQDTPPLVKKPLGLVRRIAAWLGVSGPVVYREFESYVSIQALVRKLAYQSFDIVHAQDVTSGAAAAAALGHRVPVIVTCHFNDDPLSEQREKHNLSAVADRLLASWYQFAFKQPDAFICVSNYTKVKSAWLRPADKPCIVIPNGVDFPIVPIRDIRTPFTISNIGTIEPRKNQRLLIETAAVLRRKGFGPFSVWLLGDGPSRDEWQTSIDELGLAEHVRFLGFQANVPYFMAQSSLYVHTALNESWGYSITESIAAGLPVLALATGGIPEQFDATKPGLLPVSTTAEELADAIIAHAKPIAQMQLAQRQLAYARARFQLDDVIDAHIDVYESLITPANAQPLTVSMAYSKLNS